MNLGHSNLTVHTPSATQAPFPVATAFALEERRYISVSVGGLQLEIQTEYKCQLAYAQLTYLIN